MYDQTKNSLTRYSCTFYWALNILYYDYGIIVNEKWILKFVKSLQVAGYLLPWGAYTSVMYKAVQTYIRVTHGIKLNIVSQDIRNGLDNKRMWWVGIKKLSTFYVGLQKDGNISQEDIKAIIQRNKWSGHHNNWKKGKWVDPWGNLRYSMSLEVLKYGVNQELYYPTARTFEPADENARLIQKYCLEIRKNFTNTEYWNNKKEYMKSAEYQKSIDLIMQNF